MDRKVPRKARNANGNKGMGLTGLLRNLGAEAHMKMSRCEGVERDEFSARAITHALLTACAFDEDICRSEVSRRGLSTDRHGKF